MAYQGVFVPPEHHKASVCLSSPFPLNFQHCYMFDPMQGLGLAPASFKYTSADLD